MGRFMMSFLVEERELALQKQRSDDADAKSIVLDSLEEDEVREVEKWHALENAFDPDSDEFLDGEEAVYEAFMDENDVLLPPTRQGASIDQSVEERRLVAQERRNAMYISPQDAARIPESVEGGETSTADYLRFYNAASAAINSNTSTTADALPRMRILRSTETMQTVDDIETVLPSPISEEPSTPIPTSPPRMVTDLPGMTVSPAIMPQSLAPSTPVQTPTLAPSTPIPIPTPRTPSRREQMMSPPPTVSPRMYTWDRSAYSQMPVTPRPSHARIVRPSSHRRRESLPASISLMG